jgi:hypothetical protein
MREGEMRRLADWICDTLGSADDAEAVAARRSEVQAYCRRYAVPGLEAAMAPLGWGVSAGSPPARRR